MREIEIPLNSQSDNRLHSTEGTHDTTNKAVLWGTDINLEDAQRNADEFLRNFQGPNDGHKYMRLLEQIRMSKELFLELDCQDLQQHNAESLKLHHDLIKYPREMIPIFDLVINGLFQREYPDELPAPIQVRTFNIPTVNMRDLNPDDIDKLVCIKGMIIRNSQIIPDMKAGFFKCSICNNSAIVEVDRGRIQEPQTCTRCGTKKSFQIVHNRCKFSDKQTVKLQETPEDTENGQTPQTVVAYTYDDLVDSVQPGDLVEVTGIYRASPLRITTRQRTVKAIYKTHLDVIHFKKTSTTRLSREDEGDKYLNPELRDQHIAELESLARQPDINEILSRSLAPNIFEFEEVKKGVLCQLFGGANKQFNESGRGRFRGEINVLLCGDPGTSKSQILQYAVNLASRSIYTSGKGSSAVGLTAYVTKDPETKQLVLESGALVLCDGGICCIDEFDKMSDSTRSVLHETMEQQTVSIAKAGIICSLNARTSILAAANPSESRWNIRASIVENIQLPPTLLSRFDLIYIILDTPNKEKDRKLAKHLVSFYFANAQVTQSSNVLDRATLARYISHARKTYNPELTEESCRKLVAAYVEMRQLGSGRKTITATPRQLESLIRLSEAHARMRFSHTVEPVDVEEAIRLMKVALQQAATDPRTGLIDMDLLATGQSTALRERIRLLAVEVRDRLTKLPQRSILFNALLTDMNESSDIRIAGDDLRTTLIQLQSDSFLSISSAASSNPTITVLGHRNADTHHQQEE